MQLLTFDITTNKEAVFMLPNQLPTLEPSIDYKEIDITTQSIKRIVLEANGDDGLNVVFLDGTKETINPAFVSRVGSVVGTQVNYLGIAGTFGTDATALLNAFKTLLGWTL